MCILAALPAIGSLIAGTGTLAGVGTAMAAGMGGTWGIAQAGLGIASSVYNYSQQRAAIGAQNKATAANYGVQVAQQAERQRQAGLASSTEKSDLARQLEAERARLTVTMAESGIYGNTADSLRSEINMRQAETEGRIDANYTNQVAQMNNETQSMRYTAQSNMKAKPNMINLGLTIGGQLGTIEKNRDKIKTGTQQQGVTK